MCLIPNSNHPSAVGVCLHLKPREQILDTHTCTRRVHFDTITHKLPFHNKIPDKMSTPLKMKLSFPEFPLKKNTLYLFQVKTLCYFMLLYWSVLSSWIRDHSFAHVCDSKSWFILTEAELQLDSSREGVKYSTADCTASLCVFCS